MFIPSFSNVNTQGRLVYFESAPGEMRAESKDAGLRENHRIQDGKVHEYADSLARKDEERLNQLFQNNEEALGRLYGDQAIDDLTDGEFYALHKAYRAIYGKSISPDDPKLNRYAAAAYQHAGQEGDFGQFSGKGAVARWREIIEGVDGKREAGIPEPEAKAEITTGKTETDEIVLDRLSSLTPRERAAFTRVFKQELKIEPTDNDPLVQAYLDFAGGMLQERGNRRDFLSQVGTWKEIMGAAKEPGGQEKPKSKEEPFSSLADLTTDEREAFERVYTGQKPVEVVLQNARSMIRQTANPNLFNPLFNKKADNEWQKAIGGKATS